MAVILTASKSFRLSAEAALALERLAAIAGRSQSALLTLLLTHFEAAQLATITSEQQADYRAAQCGHEGHPRAAQQDRPGRGRAHR